MGFEPGIVVLVFGLVDDDFHARSTGKSEWLATFENGAMWFVAMLDCEGWGPAGFVGFAVNGIGDAESGRFLICFSAPEFNFICDGWIVKGIGFDAEFFDEKSA